MSKGVEVPSIIMYAAAIFLFTIGIVFLSALFKVEPLQLTYASKEVVATTTLHQLITSKSCVSTGETGILSVAKLTSAFNARDELSCSYVPNLGYRITVVDLVDLRNAWYFGYTCPWYCSVRQEAVIIVYPDGRARPARLTYTYSYRDDDLLLYVVDQAAKTFYTGRDIRTVTFSNHSETLRSFSDQRKVCSRRSEGLIPRTIDRCKTLRDGLVIKTKLIENGAESAGFFEGDRMYEIVTNRRADHIEVVIRPFFGD